MQYLLKYTYEGFMILLVLATMFTLWTDNIYNSTINLIVWFIFFIDFLIQFLLAKKKWQYIKNNPFLVIAIIPFDQFFQIARIVRLFYMFRIKTIAKYYITPYVEKVNYKTLVIMAATFFVLLLIIANVIWQLEDAVISFYQGVYLVVSHLLFFGHHLFIVTHTFSIFLLTIVSVTGVVIQGLALQWGFSKMEKVYKKIKKSNRSTEVS